MIRYNKKVLNEVPFIPPPIPIKNKEPTQKQFSQNEVDELINKAVTEISLELESKYVQDSIELTRVLNEKSTMVLALEEEVQRLNGKIDAKDSIIIELTKQVNNILNSNFTFSGSTTINSTTDMDIIFIDPSVSGAENNMQNHIIVEEIKGENTNIKDNVSKLKSILGKK